MTAGLLDGTDVQARPLNAEHASREIALIWRTNSPRREEFENAARRYVVDYLRHMTVEETTILPAARASLQPDDWQELNAAFEANRDPLAGHDPSGEYAPLFRKIVNTAPAPVGLG